jgi:hypothetical protein
MHQWNFSPARHAARPPAGFCFLEDRIWRLEPVGAEATKQSPPDSLTARLNMLTEALNRLENSYQSIVR